MQSIVSLIRRELGKFMSQYKLTRYLASHGVIEYENARTREKEIGKLGQTVADTNDPIETKQPFDDFIKHVHHEESDSFKNYIHKSIIDDHIPHVE